MTRLAKAAATCTDGERVSGTAAPAVTCRAMEIQRSVTRLVVAVTTSVMIVLAGWTQGALAAPPGDEWSPVPQKPPSVVVITVTGVVSPGVESGCRILSPLSGTGGPGYLLLGGDAGTPYGEPVRVTGELRPDLLTTCQQGTPLLVSSMTPV